jgi:hypothetical protein
VRRKRKGAAFGAAPFYFCSKFRIAVSMGK